MNAGAHFLDVKIMGREYRVACSPEEREALQKAVNLVDSKMREIAQKTKTTLAERVAVMAALNIAHEHLGSQTKGAAESEQIDTAGLAPDETRRRIEVMGSRLDAVLTPQHRLDI